MQVVCQMPDRSKCRTDFQGRSFQKVLWNAVVYDFERRTPSRRSIDGLAANMAAELYELQNQPLALQSSEHGRLNGVLVARLRQFPLSCGVAFGTICRTFPTASVLLSPARTRSVFAIRLRFFVVARR
jgi:hypothetical protein